MRWQVVFPWSFFTFFALAWLPAQTGNMVVEVIGVKSDQGQIGVSVFRSSEGFPGENEKALYSLTTPARSGSVVVTFPDVPAGNYAVSVMHDENGNTVLDTNLFGIPKEGWSVSNDVRGSFGPPKFDAAVFSFTPGDQPIRITLHY